jgi:hypothetical protein
MKVKNKLLIALNEYLSCINQIILQGLFLFFWCRFFDYCCKQVFLPTLGGEAISTGKKRASLPFPLRRK